MTDTFQLGEPDGSERLYAEMFPQNSERVARQKKSPLTVIFGNPPYSVGQKSANDNAQNQSYDNLDNRIARTYAALTSATNKNSLYDSYIKAFRWSSDRLLENKGNGGIVCFVSNGAWLDGNSSDGFRKTLEKEFSSIYIFNLRGNARTSGELRQKEAGNVFGGGSRTPISITLLVKNPSANNDKATIYYRDIGDYLSREEKLDALKKYKTVGNEEIEWKTILPNEHGDWINKRNDSFDSFIPLGDKDNKNNKNTFFVPYYSSGLKTQRDAWGYNSSREELESNISKLINFYNLQKDAYLIAKQGNPALEIKKFVTYDSTMISWTRALEWDAEKGKSLEFADGEIVQSLYRPFFKQRLYFNRSLNEMVYLMPKLFPNSSLENKVICVSGIGASKDFSALISNNIPDLQVIFNGQCFPLNYYEEYKKENPTLFDKIGKTEYIRRDGVSEFIYERAKKQYGKNITKEDIFYYVYGFLHSPEYRETFANDLKKMLPRLPLVDDVRDFWAFSKAGRELADLHINYESVPAYDGVNVKGEEIGFFTVEKMRFPRKDQKDSIHYNSRITISNIPAEAYEYVVNGKSAIEWIMERYAVSIHKDSGIKNDPNDWAKEVGNPRYILDLLLSVINVSVQTVEIVKGLPKVNFE